MLTNDEFTALDKSLTKLFSDGYSAFHRVHMVSTQVLAIEFSLHDI